MTVFLQQIQTVWICTNCFKNISVKKYNLLEKTVLFITSFSINIVHICTWLGCSFVFVYKYIIDFRSFKDRVLGCCKSVLCKRWLVTYFVSFYVISYEFPFVIYRTAASSKSWCTAPREWRKWCRRSDIRMYLYISKQHFLLPWMNSSIQSTSTV